jgi:hypothetical protein
MSRCLVRSSLGVLLALLVLMVLSEESEAQLRLFRRRCTAHQNCRSLPCNTGSPSCAGAACHSAAHGAQQSRSANTVRALESYGHRCAIYNAGVAGYDEHGYPNLWAYIMTDWSTSQSNPQVGVCDGNMGYVLRPFNIDPLVCPPDSNPQDQAPDTGANVYCFEPTYVPRQSHADICHTGYNGPTPPEFVRRHPHWCFNASYCINHQVYRIKFYQVRIPLPQCGRSCGCHGRYLTVRVAYQVAPHEFPHQWFPRRNPAADGFHLTSGPKCFGVTINGCTYDGFLRADPGPGT